MKILTLLILLFMSSHVLALPRGNAVPGGIAVIPLEYSGINPPHVRYHNQRVMVVQENGQWHAVVGIPLGAKQGEDTIKVSMASKIMTTHPFKIKDKEYEVQRITLKNRRMVNPYEKDLERIKKEKKIIQQAFRTWSDDRQPVLQLNLPAKGQLSSPFGLKRFFNDQPRKPHSGLDIAAPEGSPVVAPAAGKIIATGNFFFNGNSVFIDHGHGLITMYCHLQNIEVQNGQDVKQGEIIGRIGKTGRVTGPHLHWSVSLNNARIDPGLLLDQPLSSEK